MIYAIAALGTEYIKFGVATDLRTRLEGLQIGCPYELKVLAICEGGRQEEREIHSRLDAAGAHHRGEWYKHCAVAHRIINEMAAKGKEIPRLMDTKAIKSRRAKEENRQSGGWMDERKPRSHKPVNWATWLKNWEQRGKISAAQGVSIAHAREIQRKNRGRFSPSIAAARAESLANPPQCGNSVNLNQISGAISAAVL